MQGTREKVHAILRRDPRVRAAMGLAKGDIWLVGGHIRDLFITGRTPRGGRDYDFVVAGPPLELARRVRKHMGGTIVALHEEATTRVVLPKGDIIDISLRQGDIHEDLNSRDYTLNAIAWGGNASFIDPNKGIEDIDRGVVRHISRDNLVKDPLRLIRAYRMMAMTGFQVHPSTRLELRDLSHMAADSAKERVTTELIRMINSPHLIKALMASIADGIMPIITGNNKDTLKQNIKLISQIKSTSKYALKKWLNSPMGQGMNNQAAIRLSALLMGSTLNNLALNARFLRRHERAAMLFHEIQETSKLTDKVKIFQLISKGRAAFLAVALMLGKGGLVREYLRFQRIVANPLIDTIALMNMFSLKPGPGLGEVLDDLALQRFTNSITNKPGLLIYCKSKLK